MITAPIKSQENCKLRRATFQIFIAAKRFKPKQEQNQYLMCRLAVGDEPPDGFWKNPETSIKQCRTTWGSCDNSWQCTVIQIQSPNVRKKLP